VCLPGTHALQRRHLSENGPEGVIPAGPYERLLMEICYFKTTIFLVSRFTPENNLYMYTPDAASRVSQLTE
jgi:hypothetical protein